jgi:hypothetical protein
MEPNWDPGVKKYFVKVLNSIFTGLMWMIACATAGIYFGLAFTGKGKPLIYTLLFYLGMAFSLYLLLRYYYRTWRK